MKRYWVLFSMVLVMVFIATQVTVRADEPLVTIRNENVSQLKPVSSFKGEIVPPGHVIQMDEVIAGQTENDITLLHPRTGETQIISKGNAIDWVLSVSPDGQFMVYLAKGTFAIVLNDMRMTHPVTLGDGTSYQYSYNRNNLKVSFSADSKHLLVGGTNTLLPLVHQWDVLAGKELLYDPTLGVVLRDGAFYSPDGTMLLNFDGDGAALLDVLTGQTRLKIAPKDPQFTARYLPDNKTLMVSSASQLEFWDTETGQQLAAVQPNPNVIWKDFVPSADGKTLAISDRNASEVQIWQLADLRHPVLRQTFSNPLPQKDSDDVYRTDGRTLAVYSYIWGNSKSFALINMDSGKSVSIPISNETSIHDIAFSQDGKLVIVGLGASYQKGSGVEIWSWDGSKAEKQTTLRGVNFQLSTDGTTLFTFDYLGNKYNYQQRRWILTAYGVPTTSRPQRPYMVLMNVVPTSINVRAKPTADAPILGTAKGTVYVQGRDASGKYVYLPEYLGWVRSDATYLNPSPNFEFSQLTVLDPSEVVAAAITPTVPVTRPTSTPIPPPVPSATPGIAHLPTLDSNALPVLPLAPEGLEPITLANYDQIRLLAVLPSGASKGYNKIKATVSSDSNWLAGGAYYDYTDDHYHHHLINLRTLSPLQAKNNTPYNSLYIMGSWSPDLKRLVFYKGGWGTRTTQLSVWDIEQGAEFFATSPEAIGNTGADIIFSPNSQLMAEGTSQSGIRVWDMNLHTLRFEVPTGKIFFSKDSQSLVLVDADLVRVYDTTDGKMVKSIRITPFASFVGHLSDDATSLLLLYDKQWEYINIEQGTSVVFKVNLADSGLG